MEIVQPTPKAAARAAAAPFNWTPFWDALFVVVIPVVVLVFWSLWGNIEAGDDAYISFRYARNLAQGHGLIWNIGGEPTQGFTNFLFVVLLAVGIKIGVDPQTWAFLLNGAGLILTAVALRVAAGQALSRHGWWAAAPAAAGVLFPFALANLVTGLETIFWTGLTFSAAACVLLYLKTERTLYLAGTTTLAFLACLTRPESVLFAALWFLMLLVGAKQRAPILIAGAIFGVCGLIYVGWAQSYYGSFLPNSFYIKAYSPDSLPGLRYVRRFFEYFTRLQLVLVGLIGLPLLFRRTLVWLAPYAVVMTLPIAYVFITPLIGDNFRFLHPATSLLTFLAALGVVELFLTVVAAIHVANPQRWGVVVSSVFIVWGTTLGGWLCFGQIFETAKARWEEGPSSQVPVEPLTEVARALSTVPGIENVLIAYGDAGKMPYISGAQLLDVVGLNDNTIAREGQARGYEWVIDYILGRKPDVIGIYTWSDTERIFNRGHGVIGTHYTEFYRSDGFQENYARVAAVDYLWGVHAQWFVRKDSPYAIPLRDALVSVADVIPE